MPRYSAFLSYSRKDADLVAPLKDALEAANLTTWYDRSEISGGDVWEAVIRRGLTQSNCLVVFVSKHTLGSYAEKEIAIARDMRKPIIPLAMDDAINTDTPMIAGLREFHYIDFRTHPEGKTAQVIEAVSKRRLAPVVSTYNVKGGVGKTTITMNLAAYYFKRANKRVLLIDFDPQTNLSTALIRPRLERERGGFFGGRKGVRLEVLEPLQKTGKSVVGMLQEAMQIAPNLDADFALDKYIHTIESGPQGATLDIVAGDPQLRQLATNSKPKDVERATNGFARFVGQCRGSYDCILIDMNPSVSTLSTCALAVSTHVLSPVKPDMFALQGLNLLDDIALENDAASTGREQIIVINDPRQDREGVVRRRISKSKFAEGLLVSEFSSSERFSLTPEVSVNPSLNFLQAYGAWGPNPNAARQSLQNVALEIGKRVGLYL